MERTPRLLLIPFSFVLHTLSLLSILLSPPLFSHLSCLHLQPVASSLDQSLGTETRRAVFSQANKVRRNCNEQELDTSNRKSTTREEEGRGR